MQIEARMTQIPITSRSANLEAAPMLSGLANSTATLADIELTPEVETPTDDRHSEEIRAELQRVLASPQFETSERNRRFLEYVIEETLAGRAGRIKGYNIATQVFGRDVNFDPQLDPVVRMEARRLRRSLERFYLTDSKGSSIRIAMPKGGYVPEFRNISNLGATAGGAAYAYPSNRSSARPRGTSIAVARFEAEGDQSIFLHFNHGFTDQIMVGLSKYPQLSVFGPGSTMRKAPRNGFEPASTDADFDFVVTGSTALFGGVVNVKVVLVEVGSDRVLWGQAFEEKLEPGKILGLRDELANGIVRALAEPFGVIFNHRARLVDGTTTDVWGPEECVLRYYQYRRSYRRSLFHQLRNSLELTAIANSDDANVLCCLSHVYRDGHRFGFASQDAPNSLLQGALQFAERAIELNPNSARAYHAKALAHWFLEDVPASLKAMRVALALNPNATEIVGDLGLLWLLLGDHDQGVPLLEQARARSPLQTGSHDIGCSLHHFVNGRYEQALADALEIRAPDVSHGFVAQAISLVRLGRRAEAVEAVARIVAVAPPQGGGVLAELGGRNLCPNLANKIVAALQDAGLPPEFAGD
jgi:adenylate cyclase